MACCRSRTSTASTRCPRATSATTRWPRVCASSTPHSTSPTPRCSPGRSLERRVVRSVVGLRWWWAPVGGDELVLQGVVGPGAPWTGAGRAAFEDEQLATHVVAPLADVDLVVPGA